MPGLGTLINVVAILVGTAVGVGLGDRMGGRYQAIVTDVLGLMTLVIAALDVAAIASGVYRNAMGFWASLVVLAALLLGGLIGTALKIEQRLEDFGHWLRHRLSARATAKSAIAGGAAAGRTEGAQGSGIAPVDPDDGPGATARAEAAAEAVDDDQAATLRFVDGFVSASLIFCIGPLAVLGSLSDGLGHGIDQLVLKSVMDGFICIAFGAALGWGVAASAISVVAVQGTLTIVGATLGTALNPAQIAGLTATGGILLIGVAFRLLRLKEIPVGDLLPALVLAPLLVALVQFT